MPPLNKIVLNSLLSLLVFTITNLTITTPIKAQVMPPTIGYSMRWPGSWQYVNPMDERYNFVNCFDTCVKPKIVNGINELIRVNGINTDAKRRSTYFLVNIPAFWLDNPAQVKAQVAGYFKVAQEKDIPVMIKIVGYVWLNYQFNDTNYPYTKENDLEWWGWSSDYVWGKGSPTTYADPNNQPYTWRNWGTPFKIGLPHPYMQSKVLKATATERIGAAAQETAAQLKILKSANKEYLFAGFIPDNEVAVGNSWFPDPTHLSASQYGVRAYIAKKCPTDVLNCLPPKPSTYTRERWINEKSTDLYRPADYWPVLVESAQDYLQFVCKIAYDAGIPREKIIAQSVADQHWEYQANKYTWINMTDAALNPYSIPGYSLYGNPSGTWLSYVAALKNKGINKFHIVEYYGVDSQGGSRWVSDISTFINNPGYPQIQSVTIQNLEDAVWDYDQGASQADAVNFAKYFINQATGSVCGNGIIEFGEQCEVNKYPNPAEPASYLNGQTCSSLNFTSGTLSCNTATCKFNTASCTGGKDPFGDINNDGKVDLSDILAMVKSLFN